MTKGAPSRAALVALATALAGCGDDEDEIAPASQSLIGAWSGLNSQSEGVEKEYCFVFCKNGRYLNDDNTNECTELVVASGYLHYSIAAQRITFSDAAGEVGTMGFAVAGDNAALTVPADAGATFVFSVSRVAPGHELCDSDQVGLRPRG
jgi:hypothetical protein